MKVLLFYDVGDCPLVGVFTGVVCFVGVEVVLGILIGVLGSDGEWHRFLQEVTDKSLFVVYGLNTVVIFSEYL